MSSPCELLDAHLSRLVLGELEPGTVEIMEAHLRSCERCSSSRARHARVVQRTRALIARRTRRLAVAFIIIGPLVLTAMYFLFTLAPDGARSGLPSHGP